MSRLLVFALFGIFFINISCERCMRCRYSYTETVIVVTPDGEEEQKIEHKDLILLDEDGAAYGDECFKYKAYKGKDDSEVFDIDNYYEVESLTTDLENFQYNCVRL